jgi:hypothetical protein
MATSLHTGSDGDARHMTAIAAMTLGERLQQAFGWIDFANELRGIARREEGGPRRPKPTQSAPGGRSSRAR